MEVHAPFLSYHRTRTHDPLSFRASSGAVALNSKWLLVSASRYIVLRADCVKSDEHSVPPACSEILYSCLEASWVLEDSRHYLHVPYLLGQFCLDCVCVCVCVCVHLRQFISSVCVLFVTGCRT